MLSAIPAMISVLDLAKRSGMPIRTARYLATMGVLPVEGAQFPGVGRARQFSDRVVTQAKIIAALMNVGFTAPAAAALSQAGKVDGGFFRVVAGPIEIVVDMMRMPQS